MPGPFDTTVTVTLPPGFRYFTPTPVRPAPAALNSLDAGRRRRHRTGRQRRTDRTGPRRGRSTGVAADTDYTLSFRTTPGLELGQARAVAKVEIAERCGDDAGRRSASSTTSDASGDAGVGACRSRATCCTSATSTARDDLDLYGFDPTPLAQVGVRLSHLAGDGDLVVYGPATDRPGNSPSPVADPHGAAVDATARGRGPRRLRRGLRARARRRRRRPGDRRADRRRSVGRARHRSSKPSTRSSPTCCRSARTTRRRRTSRTCCASARSTHRRPRRARRTPRTGGVAGTLPDLTALPADLATIILVNQQRLGDTFGADGGRRRDGRARRRSPRGPTSTVS